VDWDKLTSVKKLGAGTFGTVFLMKDTTTELTYALKMIEKKKENKRKHQTMRVKSEVAILTSLKSPFICYCYGMQEDDYGFYLLLELINGGELKEIIHPKGIYMYVCYMCAFVSIHLLLLV
jgi:cGMP-dependent protein kinase 1